VAVLSIQSHVVYGYAGNSAAVFPMQRLGREVWAVNTVEFSNHSGYGAWTGQVLGAPLAAELVKGLCERKVLNRCDAVLSGYLGTAEMGAVIADTVRLIRAENPGALYCCDPVMGDAGRGYYVKPDIPGVFRNELRALADIMTPNQFELEALTGIKTAGIDNARRAIQALHEKGPSVILVTSWHDEITGSDNAGRITMLASGESGLYRVTTPMLPLGDGAAGSGDMTAAIFLSRFLETKDIQRSLELCAASVYGVLEKSFLKEQNSIPDDPLKLRLIEAQDEIVSPGHVFKAEKI
jgi:pyridoxine kinase